MPDDASTVNLKSIVRLLEVQSLREKSDPELVQQFVASRNEAAFRVIVERHGPMVLGVCRRALHCPYDSEDAFQAVFLVLSKSASSIRKSQSLGSWLHGIARRVSSKLIRDRHRRQRREMARISRPASSPVRELTWAEVQTGLDEELQRLPENYRTVLVCCYLEGKTRDEAARQLALSAGELHGRLERARRLLAERLTARGLTLASGLFAVAVSPGVLSATLQSAVLYAVGKELPLVGVSETVAHLVKEVSHTMLVSKLKFAFGVLLLCGAVGITLAFEQPGDTTKSPPNQPPPPPLNVPPSDVPPGGQEATLGTPVKSLLTLTGADSQVSEAANVRVSDATEWKKLWLRHLGVSEQESWTARKPMFEIDFQRSEMIVIFRGKATNRRGIWIESITENAEQITIRYEDATYQTSGGSDQAQAYGFLLLPVSKKTIVIERDVQGIKGQPRKWKEEARMKSNDPPTGDSPKLPTSPAPRKDRKTE